MIDISKEDMITGDKFERIAERLGILFAITHEVSDVITSIRQQFVEASILTHSSIGAILPPGMEFKPRDVERFEDFEWDEDVPKNIKYWFAQNVVMKDARLIPIPLGVERDHWSLPQRKKDVILALRNQEVAERGLAYLNVNPETNRWRARLYELFGDKEWCTVEHGKNGSHFDNFAQKIRTHKFTLSPEGNGMDTHRTWEALYLGSYPIARRRRFTEEFAKQLPILVIDNWEQVTKDFLNAKYLEMSHKEWNWEALKIGYWEDAIRNRVNA